ncbi:SGNH/GDSL hydrolase family protein [Corynebacterium sp. LK2536]
MPDDRFAAQLNHRLPFNIYNGGYSGTTLLQAACRIFVQIPTVAERGDSILLFSSQSDASCFSLSAGYWTNDKTYTALQPPLTESPEWEASFTDTAALIDSIVMFCRGMNFKLALCVSPYLRVEWERDRWLRRNYGLKDKQLQTAKRRAALSQVFRDAAKKNDIPLADLESALAGDPKYFYDELHVNKAGQDRVAEVLTEFFNIQKNLS